MTATAKSLMVCTAPCWVETYATCAWLIYIVHCVSPLRMSSACQCADSAALLEVLRHRLLPRLVLSLLAFVNAGGYVCVSRKQREQEERRAAAERARQEAAAAKAAEQARMAKEKEAAAKARAAQEAR